MNRSIVVYVLGWALRFEQAFLLLPVIVGAIYHEKAAFAYLFTSVLCGGLGLLFSRHKPENTSFFAKEGFLTVSLSWILLSIIGAIPFVLSGAIPNFVDALFESVSGFTTTGATILTDVEALSHTDQFWRCFTHLIGGMGVLVFMLAITPLVGGGGVYLMKAESAGPSVSKLVPRLRTTSVILYGIYVFFMLLLTVLLLLGNINLFESLCIAFSTMGTGGFGIHNDSFASYSPYIQTVVAIFMLIAGTNFGFYYLILAKKIKAAFKLSEIRWYLAVVLFSTIFVIIGITKVYHNFGNSLLQSFFHVVSVMTTTGFSGTDFDGWKIFSINYLVILMFVGSCAGSTSGGVKISRIIIMLKTIKKELLTVIHPRNIKKITIDGHVVENEVIHSTAVFVMIYFIILLVSIVLLSLNNYDLEEVFSATAITLNNVGVDPTNISTTFAHYSYFSKFVLMFNMLAGRLELLPLLVLFAPSTWRK